MDTLWALKKSRDFFAHHFFREENEKMFSDEAALRLILRMNVLRHKVKQAEKTVDRVGHTLFKAMYPDEDLESKLESMLSDLKAEAIENPRMTFGWEECE